MIDGGGGSIVNISSVEGLAGSAHLHSYVAAKFGLRGITNRPQWSLPNTTFGSTPSTPAWCTRR
jgi:NAD(P)-dependent dehydrogenase (short-subunit alcohol dehydrogenase family)